MEKINYNQVVEGFLNYVKGFDADNKDIKETLFHSYQTASLAEKLGKLMALDEEQIELVKTLGLIHDLGRFQEIMDIDHFQNNIDLYDHAHESVVYLFENNNIRNFIESDEYDDIIKVAIDNHNKYQIPDDLSTEEEFYTNFLRDVDKIDIFRKKAVGNENIFKNELSPSIKKSVFNCKLADKKEIKNETDQYFAELAYVFDINFQESFDLLVETDNFNLYFEVGEISKELEEEFEEFKIICYEYIISRMEEIEIED